MLIFQSILHIVLLSIRAVAIMQRDILFIVFFDSCKDLVRQVDLCPYHLELRIYPWAPKMLDTWCIIEVFTPSPRITIQII